MIKDIFKSREEEGKMPVSVTLDKKLYNELKKLQKKLGMETFSPVVNDILWDWYNKNNKRLLKEIEEKDISPKEYVKRFKKGELSAQQK